MAAIDEIVKEHTGIAIEAKSVFKVNSANRWMQEAAARPTPKKLFGGLWVEGELSILYADTGIGKTILAVQIADNISSGKELLPFENETEAQKILYVDFELTDKQFQMRYTDKETMKMHHFSDNFLRAEISFDDEVSEEMIMQAIENEILTKQVKVLIVDNITYLNGETEKGRHALPLMKQLNQLKKQYGLSILVLAHTPKRDESRPIILNDLYGSKMISNFIDGAFAIGRSNEGQNLRYIKQVKCRSNEMEYFSENVILVELVKSDCMIHFEFLDFSNEALHLKQFSQSEDSELTNKIFELSGQGYTQRKIADEIGRSVGYVNKFLKHKKQ